MLQSLDAWLESVRFTREVHGVVSMRLMRLALGGPQAAVEAHRMMAEKLDAFADVEAALVNALADGDDLMLATERAYGLVRECVHANSRRLLREMV